MKVYSYTAHDLGLNEDIPPSLRFDECEATDNVYDADVILVPPIIQFLKKHGIDIHKLCYIGRWPEKHVIWDVSDDLMTFPALPDVMFLRCTLTDDMLKINPRSRAISWPAENLGHIVAPPEGGFEYDVSFHGWASDGNRVAAARSCQEHCKADVILHNKFFAYVDQETQDQRRQAFLNSIHKSRFVLAPPSIYKNCFPYRFFEAMSAGRVPIMVGEGQVYPFADRINWDRITIQIGSEDAADTGKLIQKALEMGDEEIVRRGLEARHAWKTWLDCRDWPRLHRILVEEML